ncbi:MAG: FG-GAP-like repeat-containing protein [Acidobacteriota bacterium]
MKSRRHPLSKRRRRLRWAGSLVAAVMVLGAITGVAWYRTGPVAEHRPGVIPGEITRGLALGIPEDAPVPRFTDVTGEAGIKFRSFAGPRTSQLPEDMGAGAAWGDFDNDGDEDLALVSAGGGLGADPSTWAPSELYENLGDGTFRKAPGFPDLHIIGMAAAWADYDADGWLDLVLTGYDTLILLRNREGTFERVSSFSSRPGFWAGAAWGDFDNDRDLDLYVCGYVRYQENGARHGETSRQYGQVIPFTLNPSSYPPERNLLFRNEGDGTFTEVAGPMGVANPAGRSLGALWNDFDGDGWLDLYVANDISDNALFANRQGHFQEISHTAWVADYRGAMGLAVGDWNGDGDDDLFITHWVAQENALYDSLLRGRAHPPPGASRETEEAAPPVLRFVDVADQVGLGQIALRAVGWGTEFLDFDADGWQDLVVANGSTFETPRPPRRLEPQVSFLFWNRRGQAFHDLAGSVPALLAPHVGRGLAVADYDADGDPDLVMVDHDQGARLLRNDTPGGHWIEFRLRRRLEPGAAPRGEGIGAHLVAHVGGRRLRRGVASASYLSQSSRTVHLGLGEASEVEELEVRWPGGGRDRYWNLQAGRLWKLIEGDPSARSIRLAGVPADGGGGAEPPPALDSRERQRAFWKVQRAAVHAMRVEGDCPAAVPLFEQALALQPQHEDSLYYLGLCLASVGREEAALDRFRTLARVNPHSQRAYRELGLLLARRATGAAGLAAAAAALETAMRINPEETGVPLLLGEVRLFQGDREGAAQPLEWSCRSNPRSVGGFFLRAFLAWERGDQAQAGSLLGQARQARGPGWKPAGSTAEGDVNRRLHAETSLLSSFWERWDGRTDELGAVFGGLDAYLSRSAALPPEGPGG